MEHAEPRYLYKIVSSTSPVREPLPERLPVSEIDKNSGFIHLSTAKQVPVTLKSFFEGEPLVYVLRISYDAVRSDIRWEDPDTKSFGSRYGEGLFPHLYNEFKLGRDEVESLGVWTNDSGWDEMLRRAKPWLLF
ncbi:hypothetical protein MPDQ_005120 [Monascus purpureus]|uniref:DUF952 domain-containing protein n=1 Tax=Monascus purpureus TaxID=5098 RepID=A0A507QIF4_MONPU|nr:hypothetical protein MPDQ_005120 [Monascus purpureus]BDD64215.1 hypothetical protein MAP00_009055 [Monascus purpureus]